MTVTVDSFEKMSGDNEKDKTENSLKNWLTWQNEWQKVQAKITDKLQLPAGDLLMNYSTGLQNINQEKRILELAKIPREFDKYRGNPEFWTLPYALPRKYPWCKHEPDYFAVKTKKAKNEIPSIDHMGVPNFVLNGTRNIYQKWQSSKYRQEQIKKLAEKIQKIVPHWPNFEDLVVIGTKWSGTHVIDDDTEKEEDLHHVSEAEDSKNVSQAESKEAIRKQPKRLNLTIHGHEFEGNEGTRKIIFNFEYNISDEAIYQELIFENFGLATMRVTFTKLEKFRLFRDIVEERVENCGFYFNKQELVILPKEIKTIPIWFRSTHPGTISESWEISTRPKMWGENFHVILVLNAYSYFPNLQESINLLITYINIQSRNLIIKNFLDDSIKSIGCKPTPVKSCVYGEKELFELANIENGRPQVIYEKNLVEDLKQIHNNVGLEGGKWDLSLNHLTKLAYQKDIVIYFDNKMVELVGNILRIEKEFEENKMKVVSVNKTEKDKKKKKKGKSDKKSKNSKSDKKSSKTDKKSKKTKKSKSSSKQSVKEEEKPEIKREPFDYSNQTQVMTIVQKLDSPVIVNTQREKFLTCHAVLSAYFNQMCHSLSQLKLEFGVNSTTIYPSVKNQIVPINKFPERLVYEYFEHHYIPTHEITDVYSFEARKKPKILRHVPTDDPEALYTTYFNKSLSEQTDKKGKKKKRDKSKGKKGDKGKEKKTKSKKEKSEKGKSKSKKSASEKGKKKKGKHEVKKEVSADSIESFNPYLQQFFYTPENEEVAETPDEISKKCLSKETQQDYNYKQYLVVYSCLSNAVDALVDTLESFDCVAPYADLNEVKPQNKKT